MRKTISGSEILYPNYNNYDGLNLVKNSKLSAKDFDCIIDPDKQAAYESGMKACQELKKIIINKLSNKEGLTEQEKTNISACIETYGHAMEIMEAYAEKTKRRCDLLTEFGGITHLILEAPDEFLFSIDVVDLFVFVKSLFELGNISGKYPLDKSSDMVAILGKRMDEQYIDDSIRKRMEPHSKKIKTATASFLKTAFKFEIDHYFSEMVRQYPTGSAPEKIYSRLRAYGDLFSSPADKEDSVTDEIRVKRFEYKILPLAFDEHKLQAYFEKNKITINKEIMVWIYVFSHCLQQGDSAESITKNLKLAIEIMIKYCDYYFEETYWHQKDEILLNRANKAYLFRLKEFLEKNISIMFDVKNQSINGAVNPDLKIDEDSFLSLINGKIHENAVVAWEEFLLSQNNALASENNGSEDVNDDQENVASRENRTIVNIDFILPEHIYSLEMTVSKLMYKLLDQINDSHLADKALLDDGEILTSQLASENAESIPKEESKSMAENMGHATISGSSLEKKSHDYDAVLSAPSTGSSKQKIKGANIIKVENLSSKKHKIKVKDAAQMMHPDAYRDDLKKLTYSGGGLYLEKGDAAIGRLWKTEDRRNPIISYSSSIQANAYILFPQEILDDLSKELSDSEYNSLMENIQLKTFLKGKYKVQGIIKIAEDNTYEMRLLGGKKEYRVLFDLNSIKNNKNLFFDNTLAYCASKVFYHNGKTDKTVAKLGEKKIKEMVSILSSSDIYIKPSLNF